MMRSTAIVRHRRPPAASRKFGSAGFTLLELLVVMIILGLIAAVVAGPRIFQYLGTAKTEAAKIQIERINGSLDLFRLQTGRYPSEEEGLDALIEQPAGVDNWSGPYVKKRESITDPWGREYLYRIPGEHGEYDLYSLGSDNADGGEGESQDVTSW